VKVSYGITYSEKYRQAAIYVLAIADEVIE
jgi:hypothetical protein